MTKTKAQQIMAATEARAADDVTAAIKDIATEFEPYIIKQRRHFHKHPELSLAEERTTSDIANQLDAMNIPYERPLKTGLVATLRGTAPDAYREDGTPRRRILLRAVEPDAAAHRGVRLEQPQHGIGQKRLAGTRRAYHGHDLARMYGDA